MSKFKIGDKVVPKDKVNGRWKTLVGDPKYYIIGTVVKPPHAPVTYDLFYEGLKYGWAWDSEIELYKGDKLNEY